MKNLVVYAGLLALFFAFLSIRISLMRGRYKVFRGDGGHDDLARAMRAQGNFAEYVPLLLILIGFVSTMFGAWSVHVLGIGLLVSRGLHGGGMITGQGNLVAAGAGLNYLLLILSGLLCLLGALFGVSF